MPLWCNLSSPRDISCNLCVLLETLSTVCLAMGSDQRPLIVTQPRPVRHPNNVAPRASQMAWVNMFTCHSSHFTHVESRLAQRMDTTYKIPPSSPVKAFHCNGDDRRTFSMVPRNGAGSRSEYGKRMWHCCPPLALPVPAFLSKVHMQTSVWG